MELSIVTIRCTVDFDLNCLLFKDLKEISTTIALDDSQFNTQLLHFDFCPRLPGIESFKTFNSNITKSIMYIILSMSALSGIQT